MDLYKSKLTEFDIIWGMNWLFKHQAYIHYLKKKIISTESNGERVVHRGEPLKGGVRLITTIKAQKLLSQGFKVFLCNVLKTEAPKSSLKDIP